MNWNLQALLPYLPLILSSLILLLVLLGYARQRRLEQLLLHQQHSAQEQAAGLEQRLEQNREAGERRQLLQGARLGQQLERRLGELGRVQAEQAGDLRSDLVGRFEQLQRELQKQLAEERIARQESVTQGYQQLGQQLTTGLQRQAEQLGKRLEGLTDSTDRRLQEISGQVERRLSEGFEKTTETFSQVLQHLSRIDEAQKRITELSGSVNSLQEILSDKRSRGAFGEVQLAGLVRNLMPERSFRLQHTLGNGARVDCLLLLPEPTGAVAVDSKFPLEGYRRLIETGLPDAEQRARASQFRQDIRKHINDIADKYIVAGETSDGAVMFIPAESVFAEIHAHFPELVEEAQERRVWMVSPTTLMAILTTARAVLKDAETREQVDVIQQHLGYLSKDFGRFQQRMENLSRHIRQAHHDVDEVKVSARKISERFEKIERVELEPAAVRPALERAKGSDQ